MAPIVPDGTPRTADRMRTAAKRTDRRPVNGGPGGTSPALIDGPPVPIWPPEPAGEPLPPSAVFAGAPDADVPASTGATRAAASPRPPSATRPGGASRWSLPLLADLQVETPANLADWLVAAGSATALVSFLLPWSATVLGAKNFGGYTDSWGLAVPSHFLILLMLAAVLTLAVMPNPVPSWIRTGVLGIVFGGLLLGLVWPYLVGGFGASLGVMGEAVAAVLMGAGGIVTVRAGRHEGVDDSV
jgi:hypothetical protein